jgi:hypothetical protein
MLKTHTGKPITLDYLRCAWTCGAWSVAERDIYEKRLGRARQMWRMVTKAIRRERRAAKRAPVIRADTSPVPIESFRDYFERMACRHESITVLPGDYDA